MPKFEDRVTREELERLLGTPVGELGLYLQALRHGSLFRGEPDNHLLSNERLEFLGDAVVNFLAAERLYIEFPDRDEGFLTRVRSRIVNGAALARYADWLNLGQFIFMSDEMERAGGRSSQTLLANAFEAVVGAIYLDGGNEAARDFVNRVVLDRIDLDAVARRRDNYKSILLEYAQARGWPQPTYRVVQQEGPAHERTFTVEVLVDERTIGAGRAGSKKKAEQIAASEALDVLQSEL